jgi:serine/threonine-protein kinase
LRVLLEEAEARRRYWGELVRRMPPLAVVLRRGPGSLDGLTADQLAILQLVDGKRPLFSVIDDSKADALGALAVVDRLLAARVIEHSHSAASETPPELSDIAQDAEELAALAPSQDEAPLSPVFLLRQKRARAEAANHPVVGRYEVLGRLGRGGMATVYLCRTRGEGGFTRRFAMKVLRTHLSESAEATHMLLREARLTGRLHHPNVVSVVDVGWNRGQPYLVMDYVAGCSVANLLEAEDRGGLQVAPRVASALVLEALAGLQAAHTLGDDDGQVLGLVHQDVSPENLLVGFDGVTRVTDFGVAYVTGALSPWQSDHGKPQYVAPERAQGHHFDHRADIFSLGVVFYRLLTGIEPFAAPTTDEVLAAVVSRPLAPPSTVGKRPRPEFDAVCLRALERDPDARYQSAEHFRGELLKRAVMCEELALGSEVAQIARRAVDVLSPGSRTAAAANGAAAPRDSGADQAIVLVRPKRARAGGETVQLPPAPSPTAATPRAKPLPVWAVAVFLVVSIGLALALEALSSDDVAPPRIPQQARRPAPSAGPLESDPFNVDPFGSEPQDDDARQRARSQPGPLEPTSLDAPADSAPNQ